jgi:hypothetical protein
VIHSLKVGSDVFHAGQSGKRASCCLGFAAFSGNIGLAARLYMLLCTLTQLSD